MRTIVEFLKKFSIIYKPLYWLFVHYLKLKKHLNAYMHRERRCSNGNEHPDKIFYVIGVTYTSAGLFAIVKSIFCHICYAVQQGYVPVIDMLNFKSQLSDRNGKKLNDWERFFLQPGGFSLEDISKSKNIIKSCSLPFPKGIEIGFDTTMDDDFHRKFSPLYEKYVVPTPEVSAYAKKKMSEVIGNRQHVLGVLCRGTDYTDSKPSGHPIQPTTEQAIAKTKEVMLQYGYEYVFLATEDKRIYNKFIKTFGKKLLFSGQKLYEGMDGKKFLSELIPTDFSEMWYNNVNYYSTIYILSKCDGLLAGLTCGSICAYLMSKKYDFTFFWNLGMYR